MRAKGVVEAVGALLDLVGVIVISGGAVVAAVLFGYRYLRTRRASELYRSYRQALGRGVLLGLEFLVAGDIIRTVAVSATFQSLGILAVIVAIRTFLSFSLEVELEGRWPWQAKRSDVPR